MYQTPPSRAGAASCGRVPGGHWERHDLQSFGGDRRQLGAGALRGILADRRLRRWGRCRGNRRGGRARPAPDLGPPVAAGPCPRPRPWRLVAASDRRRRHRRHHPSRMPPRADAELRQRPWWSVVVDGHQASLLAVSVRGDSPGTPSPNAAGSSEPLVTLLTLAGERTNRGLPDGTGSRAVRGRWHSPGGSRAEAWMSAVYPSDRRAVLNTLDAPTTRVRRLAGTGASNTCDDPHGRPPDRDVPPSRSR